MLTADEKDSDVKLSVKARQDMDRVISEMNTDGKKDKVRAAWEKHASKILEPLPGPKLPSITDPAKRPSRLKSTPGSLFPRLVAVLLMKTDIFLDESDEL